MLNNFGMSEQEKNFAVVISIPQYFVGTAKKPSLEEIKKFCEDNNIVFFENIDFKTNISYLTNYSIYDKYHFYIILCHDKNIQTRHYRIYKYLNTDNLTTNLNVIDITTREHLLKYLQDIPVYANVIPVVLTYNMDILKPEEVVIPFIKKIDIKNKLNNQLLKSDVYFRLDRKYFTRNFTLGELFKNDEHYCYTVEDRVRFSTEVCERFNPNTQIVAASNACKKKIATVTAIPCGTYKVENTSSGKFKCKKGNKTYNLVPKLFTVYGHQPPCFTQIAMHSGETTGWSEGCIIMSTKIIDKENGIVANDGQALMDDIFNMIYNGYGQLDITQKVNGKNLTEDDITKISKGERLGDIIVNT